MMQCIILEDEKSAQEVLENYISKTPFMDCLGTYETGLDIPPELLERADLLFLDIQLPELNGLHFLKTLRKAPFIIVSSAYAHYAIEAFEEAVIDYLVKPFSYERFFKAVMRVHHLWLSQQQKTSEQLFLYSDKTIYTINTKDILFLKAEVDYVNVVTSEKEVLVLDSLRNWNKKLQGLPFAQVHRSYVINIKKISKIYGNQVFIGDVAIPIGKTFKEAFLMRIKT
ncbi:LytR/AlgR family response regulator transcription factor [Spongiimicrobium salis]|uniref:LytR/AlgR family response regulator transcription factor n=1 Tax=Spongiimicrobium salis TaxID=1667022 RepID=UPI00374DE4E1